MSDKLVPCAPCVWCNSYATTSHLKIEDGVAWVRCRRCDRDYKTLGSWNQHYLKKLQSMVEYWSSIVEKASDENLTQMIRNFDEALAKKAGEQ